MDLSETPLDDEQHVARYCSPSRVDAGRPLAIAFELGLEDGVPEMYLSVYWLEFLGGTIGQGQIAKLHEFLATSLYREPARKRNGRFARLNVGQVRREADAAVPTHPLNVRHEPRGPTPDPHSGIYGILKDEDELTIAAVLRDLSEPYPAL